jgi:hypothetical protein
VNNLAWSPSHRQECLDTLEQLRCTLERLHHLNVQNHRMQPSSPDLPPCLGLDCADYLGLSAMNRLAAEGSSADSLFATEPIAGDQIRPGASRNRPAS